MWRHDAGDGNKTKTVPNTTYDSLYVRPAFYIEADFGGKNTTGTGSADAPWRLAAAVVPDEEANAAAAAKVGKYINLGKYNNVDITYKIWGTRDVDNDGKNELFVAPEQLLFQSAYNTASVGNWAASSLRSYLNDGTNGFLAGFSAAERSIMAQVTQKTLYGQASGAAGGNCFFLNTNSSVSNWCVGNATAFNTAWATAEATDYKYDNAYYTVSTDTIFIPSIKDAADYQIIPGTNATVNAAVAGSATPSNSAYYYWFRDNQAGVNMWRYDMSDGKMKTIPNTTYDSLWVRPAFYIEADFGGYLATGAGTAASPYRLVTEQVSGLGELTIDSAGVVTAVIYNTTGAEQTYTLMVAQYDRTTKQLTDVDVYPCVIGAQETGKAFPAEAIDLSASGKSYKVFLWNPNLSPTTVDPLLLD
ncbi:MAG: hypothetical protein E7409_03385 [Ruminococcaceae bacterium]|nr:hypothetical protein [Oscillospiraceae bacterium]